MIGRPVVLYLDNPREKVWGLLIQIGAAGVLLRGLDLAVFDDWLRQEARRGEAEVALTTVFYPMARVARMELDETSGQIPSCAERFLSAVGRSVYDVLGVESPEESSASGRRRSLR